MLIYNFLSFLMEIRLCKILLVLLYYFLCVILFMNIIVDELDFFSINLCFSDQTIKIFKFLKVLFWIFTVDDETIPGLNKLIILKVTSMSLDLINSYNSILFNGSAVVNIILLMVDTENPFSSNPFPIVGSQL